MVMESAGYLFPGQGSQFVGMGREFHDSFASARKVFDQAESVLGYSIRQICFEGPEEKLTQTLYAQPAIFTVSMACLSVLEESFPGIQPTFAAGLSLGEFSALTALRSLPFNEGLRLVQKRAEAMENAAQKNRGTMASIMGLSQSECESVARESGSEVANLNSPDQTVLSGTLQAIEQACQIAEAKGAKRALPLKVGGAFHSSLMAPARADLEQALYSTPIQKPQGIFVPNAEASPISEPDQIRALLARQLVSPVRWVETMAEAAKCGTLLFLEIGPGKVLKGLAKKCQPAIAVEPFACPGDITKLQSLLSKAGI